MILNLFAYPSNFGQISIYKCDLFGLKRSTRRYALCDSFAADINQEVMDEELLFGGFNQQNYFKLENRDITLNCNFLFSKSLNGTIDPALDLIFNSSAYAYQGTLVPLKLTLSGVNSTELTYAQPLPFQSLNMSSSFPVYLFYLVNQNQEVVQINPTSVDTITRTVVYDSITPPSDCWLEVFKYGNEGTMESFPLYQEPMLRIDCSEGSFYPCVIDSLSVNFQEDYIQVSCKMNTINYNRSERFNFINASLVNNLVPMIHPLHKSRVRIINNDNGISSDFDVTDLNTLDYMKGLTTQKASSTPITEISLNIQNGIKPVYSNVHSLMPRTYVSGFVSEKRTVDGTMKVLALRSVEPTFNRYPFLSTSSSQSILIKFENQLLKIPYTVWKPGKTSLQQGQNSMMDFNWSAITRNREGQPVFIMEGEL